MSVRFCLVKSSLLSLQRGNETCRFPTNPHGMDRSANSTSSLGVRQRQNTSRHCKWSSGTKVLVLCTHTTTLSFWSNLLKVSWSGLALAASSWVSRSVPRTPLISRITHNARQLSLPLRRRANKYVNIEHVSNWKTLYWNSTMSQRDHNS